MVEFTYIASIDGNDIKCHGELLPLQVYSVLHKEFKRGNGVSF